MPNMNLGFEEMVFIFCGQHPLLVTRIEVRDLGPKGPLVYKYMLADLIAILPMTTRGLVL